MRFRRWVALFGCGLGLMTMVSCRSISEGSDDGDVEPGNPNTVRATALLYGLNGEKIDYPEAMKLLIQAGSAGDALAMYYRGVALAEGWSEEAPDPLGARRSIDRSYLILRRMASDGNIEALYAVGEITASGRHDAPDWTRAEPIYRFCMEHNFLPAYREMGRHAVETGAYEAAIDYLTPAVAGGDATAKYWLARAYLGMHRADDARGELLQAARQGMPMAMYEVADRAVDPAERERWMLRAACAGVGPAQYELALGYENSNPELYRYWLNLAVLHDDAAAMRHLARGEAERNFEVNRMVLLLLARCHGENGEIGTEIAAADADSGLYWPVVYSSLAVFDSGTNYALLNREILRIADDYRAGSTEVARQAFTALVRAQGAALPPSLIWFHFRRCGLPLGWLAEEPASVDTLGMAVAAGLAGDGPKQRVLAMRLTAEAARRTGEQRRAGEGMAAILTADGWMLDGNPQAAQTALAAAGALTPDEVTHAVNFINECCPALRRDPGVAAAWLGVAPERFNAVPGIVRQPFPLVVEP